MVEVDPLRATVCHLHPRGMGMGVTRHNHHHHVAEEGDEGLGVICLTRWCGRADAAAAGRGWGGGRDRDGVRDQE